MIMYDNIANIILTVEFLLKTSLPVLWSIQSKDYYLFNLKQYIVITHYYFHKTSFKEHKSFLKF